jgi:hypothetical protein
MRRVANICSSYEHIEENPIHEMDYENIQVIDRASSNFKLRMKEPITYSGRTIRIEQTT